MNRATTSLILTTLVLTAVVAWAMPVNANATIEKVLFHDDFESVAPGSPMETKIGQWRGHGVLGACGVCTDH